MRFFRNWWSRPRDNDKQALSINAVASNPVDSRKCGLVDAVRSGWYQNNTDELFKGFRIEAADVVLDVGCGAGGATLFCANRGAHVVFTDTVDEKIRQVSERIKDTPARKIEGVVSDSCPLPLPDAYATKVIALEVLEHIPDPLVVLKELARVASPGAKLLLVVPDAAGERLQQGLAPSSYFSAPNHIHIFERDEFANLIVEAGLVVEKRDYYGFYWLMWMMFYWTSARSNNVEISDESHDVVHPPYPPLVSEWAELWHKFLQQPESETMRRALDQALPKSQIIIARKPALP